MHFFQDNQQFDGLRLKPSQLRYFTARLRGEAKLALTSDSLVVKHNGYTKYCISLVLWGTGARPIIDPLQHKELLDLDNELALISDKVTDESRAFRLIPLAPMVKAQIQHYLDHLKCLTYSCLRSNDIKEQKLGKAISNLLDHPTKSTPLFFLIDGRGRTQSLRPRDLIEYWSDILPVPPNFGRHFLATELSLLDCPQDAILALLGHSLTPEHWCGENSEYSSLEIMSILKTKIQDLMVWSEWTNISGHKAYDVDSSRASDILASVEPATHSSKTLGHQSRKNNREIYREDLANLIQSQANKLGLTSGELINQKSIMLLKESALEENRARQSRFSEHAISNSLIEWIGNYEGRRNTINKYGLTRLLKPEKSPFSIERFLLFRTAVEGRKRLIYTLNSRQRQKRALNPEEYLAHIVVSAALFSDMCRADHLTQLPASISTHLFRTNKVVHIEFFTKNNDGEAWTGRWEPDKLSLALLTGYRRIMPQPEPDIASVNGILSSLVSQLGFAIENSNPYKVLSKAAKALVTYEQPGYRAAALRNLKYSTDLHPIAFGRQLSGLLPGHLTKDKYTQSKNPPKWLPKLNRSAPIDSVDEFGRNLRELFNEIYTAADSGKYQSQKQRNRQLAQNIKRLTEQYDETPVLCSLIAAWAFHLCTQGTEKKQTPATGTLDKYIFLVLNGLKKAVGNSDFTDFTSDEYEEAYQFVIDVGPQEKQSQLVHQLALFHNFLVEHFTVEPCAWLYREDKLRTDEYTPSGNTITQVEYLRALELVISDKKLTERKRILYQSALILGFRWGLRFGEVLRLTPADFMFTKNWTRAFISVKNSVYGRVKREEAGVRTVPLLENLLPHEINRLEQVLAYLESEVDPNTGIMAESFHSRHLVDRAEMNQYLNETLKTVTGDTTAHFHLLRHSFASRVSICLTKNTKLDSLERWESLNIDTDILSESGMYRQPTKALSAAIGHTTQKMTISTYIHSLNNYNKEGDIAFQSLSDTNIAFLLREEAKTLWARKYRSSEKFDPLEVATKKLNLPSLVEGWKEYKKEKYISHINALEQIPPPHSIAHILHTAGTRLSYNGLAFAHMISDSLFSKIIQTADKTERRFGLDLYNTCFLFEDNEFIKLNSKLVSKQPLKEHLRVLDWLFHRQKFLVDLPENSKIELEHCLSQWLHPQLPHQRKSTLNHHNLDTIPRALSILGIKTDLILEIPTDSSLDGIREKAVELGYRCESVNPRNIKSGEKSKLRGAEALGVRFENIPHNIATTSTLLRLVLVLIIWLKLVINR